MRLLPAIPLLLAATAAAQSTQPPRRAHHAVAYDDARQRVILTAGSTPVNGGQSFTFFNDRWEFDGTRWTAQPASGAQLSGTRMAFDRQRNRMYSFGGYAGRALGEVRVLEADGWRSLAPHPEIVAAEPGFVYDAARRNFVQFGGSAGRGRANGDTWIFDGSTWTRSTATGPVARQSHAMVYDERRQRVVLFGGMGAAGPSELLNDLWEFDGARWTKIDRTGPSARNGAGAAFDAARNVVIIFGGSNASGFLGDTWSWNGTAWTKLSDTGPAPRVMGELAFDRRRGRVVLFGGRNGWPDGDLNDTWEWNGTRWTRVGDSPSTGAQGPSDRLRAAADSFVAMSAPPPSDQWPDRSDAARERTRVRTDRVADALRSIDRGALTDARDVLLYDNLRESVEGGIATRQCRSHLWSTPTQFGGWHVSASNTARTIAVSTGAERERALSMFARLPAAIREERGLLQRGLDSGYTVARPVVEAVIRQLADLLPVNIEASPLFAPAQRDSSPQFRDAWRRLLVDSVYPAAASHREFLNGRYLAGARAEGALAFLPGGAACYAAMLRAQTSVAANADSLLRDARGELERIRREAAPLVQRLTGDTNLSSGIIALRSSPRFSFPDRDSVLAAYRAMNAVAATRFPRIVAGFAPESLAVLPYPAFQERANLPPQYLRASDDGSRPAQFMVNLARMERMAVANAVAHEGYPGHHLQRIAARQAPLVHPVMRVIGVSGFTEGWGIYSEEIAGEMGMYVTPLDSVGVLIHLLDVAAGNYLDVAYHTRGMTRAQLVDSMVLLGGRPRAQAEAYADRHAATPGQLATYYIGYRAIAAARRDAARELGPAFSVAEFHREVIRDGAVTLASMRAKIDAWVRARRRT